jgi:hypothetical protein
MVTLVPLITWFFNAISNSKLGRTSEEANTSIYTSKKISFWITYPKHPLRFNVLHYIIGLILFILIVLIVILSVRSGAIYL